MNSQTQVKSIPKPHIAILIFMASLSPVALNIFIPSMPHLVESLNTNYSTSQLTLTLYLAALAFAQLILGPLSDKVGRRPVLLAGVALYIAASLACAFANNIEQLIAGRILQAAGGCVGIVITRAIVRDLYDRNKAASILGYMTMVMVLMPLAAPTIGGWIDQYASWRGSFYFITLMGIFALFFAYQKLYETHFNLVQNIDVKDIFKKYIILMRHRQYVGYVLTLSFTSAVFYCFIAGAPFLLVKILNLSTSHYGYYFVLVSGGYMLGNLLSGKLSTRFGSYRMIGHANIIMVIGMLVLAGAVYIGITTPTWLFVAMIFVGCSNGIAIPNCMAGALSIKPDIAGTASGLAGFIQIAFGALATFFVGYFHNATVGPMVIGMFISAILGIISFYALVKKAND